MNFPLAIERFQNEPEFQKKEDKEFLQLFIDAVNATYEIGKRKAYSGFCLTVEMLKAWQKRYYGREMEREADKIFLDVFTEYSNDAYQQGVRASGRVFDIPIDTIKIFPCFETHKSYYYKHVSPKIGSRKVQQIERREILALQKEKEMDNLKIVL